MAIASATARAISICWLRTRNPGTARASAPRSPKIASSAVFSACDDSGRRVGGDEVSGGPSRARSWRRCGRRDRPVAGVGEELPDRGDALVDRGVDGGRARLVVVVALAGAPLERRERGVPELVQPAHAVDRLLRRRDLAQRGLVRARDVLLLLVDAVLALRAVRALLGGRVAVLDDLDALHLPAHRVEVPHGIEVAVERFAGRIDVGADVVVLRAGVAADHAACGR